MKIDKSWYIKPKKDLPKRTTAGGIVIRVEDKKFFIRLIQDSKYEDWILPKGRVEEGETLEEAARREVAEETGLDRIELINKLGIKERLIFKKDEWLVIHYFLFYTDQIDGTPNLQEDEKDYISEWFSLDDLPIMFWLEQKEIIEENRDKIKNLLSDRV